MARAQKSGVLPSRLQTLRNLSAHNENVSKKGMPNINHKNAAEEDDVPTEREYTIDYVIKMVSFWFQAVAHKVNIVEVKTADESSSFSGFRFDSLR